MRCFFVDKQGNTWIREVFNELPPVWRIPVPVPETMMDMTEFDPHAMTTYTAIEFIRIPGRPVIYEQVSQ